MKSKEDEKEGAKQFVNSLEALSLTELNRIKSDEEYMRMTTLCSQHHLKSQRKGFSLQDQALQKANENIKVAADLEETQQILTETVLPHFEEQVEISEPLLQQVTEMETKFTRQNYAKVLDQKMKEALKASEATKKEFNKNQEKDQDEFITEYLTNR